MQWEDTNGNTRPHVIPEASQQSPQWKIAHFAQYIEESHVHRRKDRGLRSQVGLEPFEEQGGSKGIGALDGWSNYIINATEYTVQGFACYLFVRSRTAVSQDPPVGFQA
jgi:hypothetical protein